MKDTKQESHQESILSFRWRNFRSFVDTGWIDIKPLMIFIGPNNSGKTSLFYPLLMLKQTIESFDETLPIRTKGKYVDVGNFKNLINNHDTDKKLIFEITFKYSGQKEKLSKKIGSYSPGSICLTFKQGTDENDILLDSLEIKDLISRRLFKRILKSNGHYSLYHFKKLNNIDKKIRNIIIKDKPKHFLFDTKEVWKGLFSEEMMKKETANQIETKLSEPLIEYISILNYTNNNIERLMKKIEFVGPLREYPKRYYESVGEKPYSVGSKGQYTPDIILQMKKEGSLNLINNYLREFGIPGKIDCVEYEAGLFSMILRKRGDALSKNAINITDIGFGISQILPLITQGQWMKENSILIAEQPEIHLNPKLQSKLADYFVDMVNSKKKVILETHSEHLLLRLRTLVAEGKIKASDTGLYFFEIDGQESKIRNIPIRSDGHIEAENWPKNFFDDTLQESFNLANAQIKGKGKRNATKPN